LVVGILASAKANEDDEAVLYWQDQFARVNRLRRANGFPEHREPVDLGDDDALELDMIGYTGLHYLRRIAAYLEAGRSVPPPGNEHAARDPLMEEYYARIDNGSSADPRKGPSFEHLLLHSDAEGFYVPIEFEKVLYDTINSGVVGGMVGSTQSLMRECRTLASAVGLSLDLDPESEEVWKATEHQGQGEATWERYGIESFSCLRLFHACRVSIQLRAAIAFA